jgi:hypothetical protein
MHKVKSQAFRLTTGWQQAQRKALESPPVDTVLVVGVNVSTDALDASSPFSIEPYPPHYSEMQSTALVCVEAEPDEDSHRSMQRSSRIATVEVRLKAHKSRLATRIAHVSKRNRSPRFNISGAKRAWRNVPHFPGTSYVVGSRVP